MVESSGLLNRRRPLKSTESSNLSLSARFPCLILFCSLLQAAEPAIPKATILNPSPAKQGDAIRIETRQPDAVSARLGTRSIRLFLQTGGTRMGLMPVPGNHSTGVSPLTLLDADGRVLESTRVTIRDGGFASQNVQLGKALTELKAAPGDAEAMDAFRATVSETRFWAEPFDRPVAGCMVSPYGVRRLHNGKATGNYHSGIDQRGAAGTPVRALTAGVVKLARAFEVSGNTVGVDHGQGLLSVYMHLSGFAATVGTRVEKGTVVGYVGSTGRSTAPHLHWSVMASGVGVNPAQWIPFASCDSASGAPARRQRKPVRKGRD